MLVAVAPAVHSTVSTNGRPGDENVGCPLCLHERSSLSYSASSSATLFSNLMALISAITCLSLSSNVMPDRDWHIDSSSEESHEGGFVDNFSALFPACVCAFLTFLSHVSMSEEA